MTQKTQNFRNTPFGKNKAYTFLTKIKEAGCQWHNPGTSFQQRFKNFMFTKNLSITDVTKNSITSKPLNNSKSLLSNQKNLGSNLHKVRIENPSRIIFGQININSIRNKFDLLMNIIKNEIDILMISETKIDSSFPIS